MKYTMWIIIICVLLVFYLATDRESLAGPRRVPPPIDPRILAKLSDRRGKRLHAAFLEHQKQVDYQAKQQADQEAMAKAYVAGQRPIIQSTGQLQLTDGNGGAILHVPSATADGRLGLPTVSRAEYIRHLQTRR